MTEAAMTLTALLEKTGEDVFLRTIAKSVPQMLMEADVDGQIGAGRYERAAERRLHLRSRSGRRYSRALGAWNTCCDADSWSVEQPCSAP